ncbi:ligase-associated DNA damage response endonuclease PdeM [Pseudoprimorskyibacter insulae]|uniref:Calcineurin-like phosphoesterase domain-containing protein n=1 Tax=Pseudoprimorskyibacter insulae TaxID=1695997 RepID=A0A2R8AVE3_9RHOB|nr:ligase-associated DNA damage response endonuclease PdeM [Pseudoprimorskyibacter insulae]SPF79991.1 hypothetical protein PRI8871_01793 [Pseudoprimorskyibacter insulae]
MSLGLPFQFGGEALIALTTGALFWPAQDLLVVSDLHMGKAVRQARFGGAVLPPYEGRETLDRLATDLDRTGARRVLCLGDSFDAPGLDTALPDEDRSRFLALQAGRDWIWVEGNHDPGPVELGGQHLADLHLPPLMFRHIAKGCDAPEISGHYHPKATLALRGRRITRPCFLYDSRRLILPAYGTYTGGLHSNAAAFTGLMEPNARAILTGPRMIEIPMPR